MHKAELCMSKGRKIIQNIRIFTTTNSYAVFNTQKIIIHANAMKDKICLEEEFDQLSLMVTRSCPTFSVFIPYGHGREP